MSIEMDSRTNYFGFRNLHIKKEPEEEMDPRKVRVKVEHEEEEEAEEQEEGMNSSRPFFKLPFNPETTHRERKTGPVYSHHNIGNGNQVRPPAQYQFYFQSPSSAFTSPVHSHSNYSQRFKVPQHLVPVANLNPHSNSNSTSNNKCLKTNTNMNRNNRNNLNNINSSANSNSTVSANVNINVNIHANKRQKSSEIKTHVESRPGMKRKRKPIRRKNDDYEYDDNDDDDDEELILGMNSDYSPDHYTPNFSPGVKSSKTSSSNSKSYYSSSSSMPELPGPGEVKPYSCNYCSDRFYSQLGIKTHLNVQHRISASDSDWHQFARKTD